MSVVVSTSFDGANGAAWPAPWQTYSGTATQQGGRGQQVTAAGAWESALSYLGRDQADGRVDVTLRFPAVGNAFGRVLARWDPDTGSGYYLDIATAWNGFVIAVSQDWSTTDLAADWSATWAANTDYRLAFEWSGTTLRAKWWPVGQPEPGAWLITATDTTFASGDVGLEGMSGETAAAETVLWDDFTLDDLAGEPEPVRDPMRVGFHNDAFVSSAGADLDLGTYSTFATASEAEVIAYAEAQVALGLPMVGESSAVSEPRSLWPSASAELARMRWSALNPEYEPDVLASWGQAGRDEAARRLGYRLRLTSATLPRTASPGGAYSVELNIANDGYGAPYRERPARLVFVDGATVVERELSLDVREAEPGEVLTHAETVTAPTTPGSYTMHLALPSPDPTLDDPAYAVQLANVDTWDDETGRNALLRTVTVT